MLDKEKLKEFFQNEKNILFAYLFGSMVTGNTHKNSDVDIAVFLKDSTFTKQLELHHRLEVLLEKDVDLLVLNTAKDLVLLNEMIRTSEVLKDHEDRAYFEVMKHHEYIDYQIFTRMNVA